MSTYYVVIVPEETNGEIYQVQKQVASPQEAQELHPEFIDTLRVCNSDTNVCTLCLWESSK
ncbi:hypothetical protein UFOVP754_44 [uncultured Caudovirales phage]|uniref:Uncharacterized protein n=1 Tax=uncultured Caudovirales phage TaxID=2100421 RepID=A0A6J7XB52_9CAUD|nr:hypothetical protein UFOVP754_44 [uncultured Caudovirales phage]